MVCKKSAEANWNPQSYCAYQELPDLEASRHNVAYHHMMPDELPTPVTWATKIWLKEALDNLMLASDCIVMQSKEEGRELIVALGRCPDTPAEKTQLTRRRICGC
jgi:hypothetical protein